MQPVRKRKTKVFLFILFSLLTAVCMILTAMTIRLDIAIGFGIGTLVFATISMALLDAINQTGPY